MMNSTYSVTNGARKPNAARPWRTAPPRAGPEARVAAVPCWTVGVAMDRPPVRRATPCGRGLDRGRRGGQPLQLARHLVQAGAWRQLPGHHRGDRRPGDDL